MILCGCFRAGGRESAGPRSLFLVMLTKTSSFSNDRKIGSRQATIFFIAFGKNPPGADFRVARRARIRDDTRNLPKAAVNSNKVRATLREIPEDASVRKPPLKEKARRQRTLTLENDELYPSFSNDRKIGSRQATIFFIAFGKNPPGADFRVARRARIRDDTRNLPKTAVNSNKARANIREIPEDASVRKPPQEKARRQRTLTLENDECIGIFTSNLYTKFPTHPITQTK